MTDQGDMTPAVWDPNAHGGAGGWVRRTAAGAQPGPPGGGGPGAGAVGDQGPPLAARPYLLAPPTPAPPVPAPPVPAPPAAAPPAVDPGGPSTAVLPPVPAAGPVPPQPPTAPAFPPSAQGGYGYPQPPAAGAPGAFPGHAAAQDTGRFADQGTRTAPAFPATAPGPYPPQPYPSTPAPPYPPRQDHPGAGYPQPGGYPQQGYQQPGHPPAGDRLDLPGRFEEDLEEEDRPSGRGPILIGLGVVLLLAVGGGTVLAMQNSGSATPPPKAAPPAASAAASAGGAPTGSAAPSGAPSAAASPSASPSGSPSAGADAQTEAKALDDLLTRGESAKAPIGSAVATVGSCPAKADIDGAAQTFDSGATQRDQLIADLGKLNLGDLPGGADAAATLKTAWQQSGDIDRAYAAWARTVSAQGCGGGRTAPSTPDKQRADELNPQATQSKKDFVAKWNALAGGYGLATRTWDRI